MSLASSSNLSCGRREVYHISRLFSMWLWLISDPRCCLVHRPEAGSQGVSVTCESPHYLCYNYTLIHVMAPKYPTSAPSTHAGCVMFCRSKGVNRVTQLWQINTPLRSVSYSMTAQVWADFLFFLYFLDHKWKKTGSAVGCFSDGWVKTMRVEYLTRGACS